MNTVKRIAKSFYIRVVKNQIDKRLWKYDDTVLDGKIIYSKYLPAALELFLSSNGREASKLSADHLRHFVHIHTKYVYRLDFPTVIDPSQLWIINTKKSSVIKLSLPFANDPWDGQIPMPSYVGYKLSSINMLELKNAAVVKFHWFNYYHFFFDTLPQIIALDNAGVGKDVPIVVPDGIRSVSFIQDFFKCSTFFNDRKLVYLKPGQYVKVSGETYFAKGSHQDLDDIQYILNTCKLNDSLEYKGSDKFFLKRDSQKVRSLVNSEEVEIIAGRYGYEIIDTEGWNLQKQVDLFANAKSVIALHGAGLTNLIFSKNKEMSVLEIFAKGHTPSFYKDLCLKKNINYNQMLGSGYVDTKQRYYLDPVEFEEKLKKLN